MDKNKLWYISTNKIFFDLPGEDQEMMASMMPLRSIKKGPLYTAKESCILLKKGAAFEPGAPALNFEKKEKDEQAAISGHGDSK